MAYVIKNANDEPIKHEGIEVFMSIFSNCVKGIDMKTRQLSMVGSDETVDRDGDICVVNGWDLKNFLANPVFLWSHQYSGPESVPLARAIKVTKKRNPAALLFTMQFPTEGVNPFADMILQLYNEKIINASSVGFIPREWEPVDPNGDSSSMFYGGGRKFLKSELLELSGCAVPCNPAALTNALKGKLHPQAPAEYAAKVVNWLMGKTAIDTKLVGIDEIELQGELQEMKCVVEEDTPVMVQVIDQITTEPSEKAAPQGVDNTEKSDYNINNVNPEDTVVATPSSEVVETVEEKEQTMLKEIKEKHPDAPFFKLITDETSGEITLEPVDQEALKGEVEVDSKITLAFGQNYTLVEPKEFIELLGITSKEVESPATTEVPAKATETPETTQEATPAFDTSKLLDSLKNLSKILPEVK